MCWRVTLWKSKMKVMVSSSKSIFNQNAKLAFVNLFFYACFCVSCVLIPDSILMGHSLCFAYTFGMVQMVEVAMFLHDDNFYSTISMVIALLCGSVLPTFQMYMVMMGFGLQPDTDSVFEYVYTCKTIFVYVSTRVRYTTTPFSVSSTDRVNITILALCVCIKYIFSLRDAWFDYVLVVETVLRFSPIFFISFLSLSCMQRRLCKI